MRLKGQLLHADFFEVALDKPIEVKVHIELVGTPTGVKNQGGLLDFITRELEIECLPTDIPDKVTVDVSDLDLSQATQETRELEAGVDTLGIQRRLAECLGLCGIDVGGELGLDEGEDPIGLRRKNFISQYPHKMALGMVIDCGDFEGTLDKALKAYDADGFEKRRKASARKGKLRGLGVSSYLEVVLGMPADFAAIEFDEDGGVTLKTGAYPMRELAMALMLSSDAGLDLLTVDGAPVPARVVRHAAGLSVFWGISQVVLAAFPAHAKEVLGEENTVVIQGLLACSGIGIILGSLIAGSASKRHIETGLIPLGALGVVAALWQ